MIVAISTDTQRKNRVGTVDVFVIVVLLALVLGVGCRFLIGRLNGPDYTAKATAAFEIAVGERSVLSEMRAGDVLLFAADGSAFGTVEEVKLLAEVGSSCKATGTLRLTGADTEAGFLTEAGRYLLPCESYEVTNGTYTVTLTLTDLTVG